MDLTEVPPQTEIHGFKYKMSLVVERIQEQLARALEAQSAAKAASIPYAGGLNALVKIDLTLD